MNEIHFNKRALEGLALPSSGDTLYRDSDVSGLAIRVWPSGRRVFVWSRRANGKLEFKTLGEFPAVSINAARAKASEYNAALAKWKQDDFVGDPFRRPAQLTLATLLEDYVAKHLRGHAKRPERAEKALRWSVNRYLSRLLDRRLAAIQHEDVDALHRHIGTKHGQRTANKAIKELRTLFNFALRTRMFRGENPVKGLEFYREEQRSRFVQPNELPKLWQALSRSTNVDLKDFINLSLWCGTRRSDTLSMRWEDVSLTEKRWTIPDPKTESYSIPLTPEAIAILKERLARAEKLESKTGIPRSDFIFPGSGKRGHIVEVKRGWKTLLRDAGLDYKGRPELRLRPHDLRRTGASYMAAQGSSLLMVGKMLGHSDPAATKIYARLSLAPVREEMERAQTAMKVMMKKPPQLPAAPKARKKHAKAVSLTEEKPG